MTSVSRGEFERRFQSREVALQEVNVDARVAAKLRRADANGDGKIGGTAEARAAFAAMDDFDRDGSRRSMSGSVGETAARALMDASRPPDALPVRPARGLSRAGADGDVAGVAKGTGYYPANTRMEGGFVDKRDTKLNTLQDFLAGKAPYVSIALDKNLYKDGTLKYGDKFRIPELEQKYGRQIEFRAVDTGGAFTNKGFSRVDICTGSRRDSLDATVNGRLTLVRQ